MEIEVGSLESLRTMNPINRENPFTKCRVTGKNSKNQQKGNFEDAEKLLKEAEESLQTAHESHRELLKMDASGEVTQVSILLCHAQDHLMGSALALDLIREMIVLYQK